jgi:hypothetical protein
LREELQQVPTTLLPSSFSYSSSYSFFSFSFSFTLSFALNFLSTLTTV